MKLTIILSVILCSNADKLDRTYLPPANAGSAGGSPGSLTTPLETPKGSQGFGPSLGQSTKTYNAGPSSGQRNEPKVFGQQPGTSQVSTPTGLSYQAGTGSEGPQALGPARFGQQGRPSGSPQTSRPANIGSQYPQPGSADIGPDADSARPQFGQLSTPGLGSSGNRIVNNPSFEQARPEFGTSENTITQPAFGNQNNQSPDVYTQQAYQQPERPQAAADRAAEILRYENENDGERFRYSFDTSNGISAEESGLATNGVQAQGRFSYTGDDGQFYQVTYTADENGYQPQGDHLPTPPPIPDEILKSIEENAKAAALGTQEGSYQPEEYESQGSPQQYGAGGSQPYEKQNQGGFSKPIFQPQGQNQVSEDAFRPNEYNQIEGQIPGYGQSVITSNVSPSALRPDTFKESPNQGFQFGQQERGQSGYQYNGPQTPSQSATTSRPQTKPQVPSRSSFRPLDVSKDEYFGSNNDQSGSSVPKLISGPSVSSGLSQNTGRYPSVPSGSFGVQGPFSKSQLSGVSQPSEPSLQSGTSSLLRSSESTGPNRPLETYRTSDPSSSLSGSLGPSGLSQTTRLSGSPRPSATSGLKEPSGLFRSTEPSRNPSTSVFAGYPSGPSQPLANKVFSNTPGEIGDSRAPDTSLFNEPTGSLRTMQPIRQFGLSPKSTGPSRPPNKPGPSDFTGYPRGPSQSSEQYNSLGYNESPKSQGPFGSLTASRPSGTSDYPASPNTFGSPSFSRPSDLPKPSGPSPNSRPFGISPDSSRPSTSLTSSGSKTPSGFSEYTRPEAQSAKGLTQPSQQFVPGSFSPTSLGPSGSNQFNSLSSPMKGFQSGSLALKQEYRPSSPSFNNRQGAQQPTFKSSQGRPEEFSGPRQPPSYNPEEGYKY